jgi:1-acyl-sn-glycerol-3-phosphate acyltransferase
MSAAATVSGAIASATLFASILVVNVVQTASLVLLPFSRPAFRAVNRSCAAFWWGLCVWSGAQAYGTRLVLTGDPVPRGENAILVANHQQMSDIFVLMMLAYPVGRLGDLKWFVKDPLKYVPGIGWGMLFLDCLFVKRNWDADRSRIEATFSKFKRDQIPIWLISFVEGTRAKPEKIARSQDYARTRGLPELKNVLLPRSKGFAASVQGLRGHLDAVYDITIGFPPRAGQSSRPPSLWDIASGRAREFHVHFKRYPSRELPSELSEDLSGEALSRWLVERFQEKDALMARFKSEGKFA